MKMFSLIKAAFSQDMKIFKYSTKKNASMLSKIMLPVVLFGLICFSIGTYAYEFEKVLAPLNLSFIMLSMFIMAVTVISFIEGIYKSQGILFEAKDNDLLFSLPIKKSNILFIRILKLLVFQYVFNLMFILPAFVVYIYFERPGVGFYLMSILMSFLIPIIPTVASSIIGYIIKLISTRFKSQKIVQTIISSIACLGIIYLSMNLQNFLTNLAENATSINDLLIKLYYPIGLYINLITKFEIMDLIKLLLINIIPLIIFIIIGAKFYFNVISRSKDDSIKKKVNNKKESIVQRKPINSLIIKELKRYFSSPVYMFNTSFGLILSIIVPILLIIKGQDVFNAVISMQEMQIDLSVPTIFYLFIMFVGFSTSISSSSISLEGKTINITKSMPISERLILKSKILTCFVIEMPFIIISTIVFIIGFKPSILYSLLILMIGCATIFLNACIGLISNLKYPKMDARNDTEAVKQSMSSLISVVLGFIIYLISVILMFYLTKYIKIIYLLAGNIVLLLIISYVLYVYLMKKGPKKYRDINI